MQDLIGQIVGGCQILDELGQGGMGVIYRARQISLDRVVALKVLADHLVYDETFVQRFQREARAIARVNHPNILSVYDVGSEGAVHYMIMELVDGRSLSEMLEERGTFPWQEATEIIRQGAEGLDAAAQAGIIHRDVKPDNLMITKRNVVKVSDFGLAKEVQSSMTATDAVMGTPAYMSPEQCDGKELDGRSDIYSLGGTFYRIVTGRLPFDAETAMSMMYRHKHEPLMAAKEIVPSLPQVISDVVTKMMEKKREDRYQTMAEVVGAIDQAIKHAPVVDPFKTMSYDGVEATVKIISEEDRVRANQLRADGDERMQRGDVVGAAKLWHEALRLSPSDPDTAERIAKSVRPEVTRQKEMGEKMLASGQIAEAARCFRNARDMDPDDEELRLRLQALENKLKVKRSAVNELRQQIAGGHFEDAVSKWDDLPPEMREEALEKQIDHLRAVVIPAARLGDEGDQLNDAGRVDGALEKYQEILTIDPTNAKARQGIKSCEAKLHRIEMMVKEGYDYNVRQDYEKAIGAWSSIFKVCPDHIQAMKLVTEARFQWGLQLRNKEGGLSKAVENWQAVLEVEPNHVEAKKFLQQDSAKLAKLSKLNEEVQAAKRAGKDGRALKLLQQMLKISPTDTRIAMQLKLARKKFHRRRSARVLLVFVAGCILIGGTTYLLEMKLIRDMESLLKSSEKEDYKVAVDLYEKNFWPPLIMKEELEDLRRRANYQFLWHAGLDAEDPVESIGFFEQAKEFASEERQHGIARQIAHRRYLVAYEGARKAEKSADWSGAVDAFREAGAFADKANLESEKRECDRRYNGWRFFDLCLREQQAGRVERAKMHIRSAAEFLKGQPEIDAKLRELKIDLGRGQDLLDQGSKAIREKRWADAVSSLEKAKVEMPDEPALIARLLFARDNLYAHRKGMVLIPAAEFKDRWGRAERDAAFLIDRYEHPNKLGEIPTTASHEDAEKACASQRKRLPTAEEWRRACIGDGRTDYIYGDDYDAQKANTESGTAKPCGHDPICPSVFGVHDMCGNLAEWTTETDPDPKRRNYRHLYGGHFSSYKESKCTSFISKPKDIWNQHFGFRCAESLPPLEEE